MCRNVHMVIACVDSSRKRYAVSNGPRRLQYWQRKSVATAGALLYSHVVPNTVGCVGGNFFDNIIVMKHGALAECGLIVQRGIPRPADRKTSL